MKFTAVLGCTITKRGKKAQWVAVCLQGKLRKASYSANDGSWRRNFIIQHETKSPLYDEIQLWYSFDWCGNLLQTHQESSTSFGGKPKTHCDQKRAPYSTGEPTNRTTALFTSYSLWFSLKTDREMRCRPADCSELDPLRGKTEMKCPFWFLKEEEC